MSSDGAHCCTQGTWLLLRGGLCTQNRCSRHEPRATHIVGVPLEPNREVLQAAIGCAGGEGNDDGLQQCRAQAQRWHRRPAKGPPISLQLGRSNACCHASRTPTGRTTPVFRRTVQAGRSSMGSGRSMSIQPLPTAVTLHREASRFRAGSATAVGPLAVWGDMSLRQHMHHAQLLGAMACSGCSHQLAALARAHLNGKRTRSLVGNICEGVPESTRLSPSAGTVSHPDS